MDTSRTYPLKHKVEIKNKDGEVIETITSLTLRRLRGQDARHITADAKLPMMMQMLGRSASLPPSTMDLLDFEDIIGAAEVAGDFFTSLTRAALPAP